MESPSVERTPWSGDAPLESLTDSKLRAFRSTLRQALKSQFYSRRLAGVFGDQELDGATLAALDALPCTTKDDLRNAGLEILAVPISRIAHYYESSGTTGVPTPTPKTAADIASNTVLIVSQWREILRPCEDFVILMVPSDVAPVADAMTYALEALSIPSVRAFPFTRGVCGWDTILRIQNSLRANTILTTPGLLLFLYQQVRTRGGDPRQIGIKKVLLLGELVTEPMRLMLERMWEADVYVSSYGCSELGTCATSCVHKTMHLLTEAYHFECRDPSDGRFVDTGHGELVVTTLTADARPLIRYATGDLVTIKKSACACGSMRPTISIEGRLGQAITLGGVEISPLNVEEVVYSVAGAIGYTIRVKKHGLGNLCIETDTSSTEELERILAQVRESLCARGIPLEPEIAAEMHELSKRGGGFKNWKVTHIVNE